jgi:hypothetical protein
MYIFGRRRYRVPFCASAMPMWKRRESGPYKFFSQMSSGVRVIRGRRHLMRLTRSGIWKQGDLHDWQPHRTSPSYLSPLPSTRLNTSPSRPGCTGRATNYVIRCAAHPPATQTHSPISIFIFSRPADSHEEPAPQRKKVTRVHNTSRAHVQGGQGEEGAKTVTSRT